MKSRTAKLTRIAVLFVPYLLANLVWRGIGGIIEFVSDTVNVWRRTMKGIE